MKKALITATPAMGAPMAMAVIILFDDALLVCRLLLAAFWRLGVADVVSAARAEELEVVVVSRVVAVASRDELTEELELVGRMAMNDVDDVDESVGKIREETESNRDELGVATDVVGVTAAVCPSDVDSRDEEDGRVGATVVAGATAGVVVTAAANADDVVVCRAMLSGFCWIGVVAVAGAVSVATCTDVADSDDGNVLSPPWPPPLFWPLSGLGPLSPPAALLAAELPSPPLLGGPGGGGGLPPSPASPKRDPTTPFEGAFSCGAAMVAPKCLIRHTPEIKEIKIVFGNRPAGLKARPWKKRMYVSVSTLR